MPTNRGNSARSRTMPASRISAVSRCGRFIIPIKSMRLRCSWRISLLMNLEGLLPIDWLRDIMRIIHIIESQCRSSQMKNQITTEVLISGAGAAGLTLAIDLARRNVSFRLIDKLDGPFVGSRGKGIQPRTLEVFEDLGIVDRIAAAGACSPPQRQYRADGSYDAAQSFVIEPPTAEEPYRTPLLI